MINEYYAKKFCCEDLSLIENYELAINDTTQTWECHHRRGTIYSGKDLKEIGEYYNRPAAELIFLTPTAHRQLHKKGIPRSEATKKAISETLKGVPKSEDHKKALSEAIKGVPLSEEHKKAISETLKGVPKPYLRGVPKSEATKKAISDAMKGVNAKKILQFTKSGEFIREWPSICEAERELGIAQSSICSCCKGIRKSAGGYIWKYA